MRVGLQLPRFTWPGGPAVTAATLADIARTADDAGFYSVWVMDHLFQIRGFGPPEHDMLEGYTTLGYLAGLTRKVKLGTMATGVIYRYPGVLVKAVTTLDVLSGGRAYFSIGAAWNEQECKGLGVPFPPVSVRFEMLEETLLIARQMWSGNDGPWHGKHYHLDRTLCVPQPLSRPHPPVLVAGGGEKKTLRLVAKYADACNLYGTPEVIAAKLEILKRHCADVGRDYATIEITWLGSIDLRPGQMRPQDAIKLCKTFSRLGVRHALFIVPNVEEITPLEVIGKEIIPAVTEL